MKCYLLLCYLTVISSFAQLEIRRGGGSGGASATAGSIINPGPIASLATQTPEFSGTSGTNMIPSTNNLITWDGTQPTRSWVFNLSGSSDPGWLFSDGVVQMTNHLRFGADNTWDIGASGATRPRLGYFGTGIIVGGSIEGGGSSSAFYFNGGVRLRRSGTDTLLVQNSSDVTGGSLISAGRLTLTPAAADTTALAISGGSTTGSGTTVGVNIAHTLNTSGNVDGVVNIAITDTASGSSTDYLSIKGGATATTEVFKVRKDGFATASVGFGAPSWYNASGGVAATIATVGGVANTWNVSNGLGLGGNSLLTGESAGVTQLGADASSPVHQTIKAHDGSGTDIAGANLIHASGQGTGTGRGGALIGKTAPSGTTGSSANAYSERYHYAAKAVALVDATATTVATIAVPVAKYVGAQLTITIFASDGTDHQARTLRFGVSAINKAGTVTAAIDTPDESIAASSGTLTAAITAVANGNAVDIKVNGASSLTETTLSAKIALVAINSNDVATVTEI